MRNRGEDAGRPDCNFFNDLSLFDDAYAYAATPKESAQRISRVSSRRSAMELGAMWSMLNGGVGSQAAANLVSQNQELLHGISRQPLTVGYTDSSHGSEVAGFGWIIGPKFELRRQHAIPRMLGIGKGYRYSHVPIQNALAGVVSLPGWWQRASVRVSACWRKPKGGNCKEVVAENSHTVDLPSRWENISEALARKNRGPFVRALPRRWDFVTGERADILIVGDNLWRSVKVTVGSQASDEITVLPNMNGIIARFNALKETPYADGKEREVNLRVWTSVGVADVGTVWIFPSKKSKKDALKLEFKAPRLVEEGVVALKMVKGSLPASYAELRMGLRQRIESSGEYSDWVYSSALPPVGEIKEVTAKFSGQTLSSFESGSKVQAALYATARPSSTEPQQLALTGSHAIYDQGEDGDQKVMVTGGGAGGKILGKVDEVLTFKFPKAAQLAFPGLDRTKTTIAVTVTSGDARLSLQEIGREAHDEHAGHALVVRCRIQASSFVSAKAKIAFKLDKAVAGLSFGVAEVEVSKP